MEVYIDDLIIKTKREAGLIPDLIKTFNNLRYNKIIPNPTKCIFGVRAVKFLVSQYHIRESKSTNI